MVVKVKNSKHVHTLEQELSINIIMLSCYIKEFFRHIQYIHISRIHVTIYLVMLPYTLPYTLCLTIYLTICYHIPCYATIYLAV